MAPVATCRDLTETLDRIVGSFTADPEMVTLSPASGTTDELQFPAVDQSVLTAPVHVRLTAAFTTKTVITSGPRLDPVAVIVTTPGDTAVSVALTGPCWPVLIETVDVTVATAGLLLISTIVAKPVAGVLRLTGRGCGPWPAVSTTPLPRMMRFALTVSGVIADWSPVTLACNNMPPGATPTTLKVATDEPAGTVTVDGVTVTTPGTKPSVTTRPPAGAG